jgi:hypothetical protein
MIDGDFSARRAPYAPISALERFFERIRDRQVPDVVDHRYLARLSVASNNEYALLSALKFLGIVDDRGKPTHAYRLLQTTDRFQDTLWHLVQTAYRPVFEAGAESWPLDDLVNFFRVSSSPSQAKNAARFFLAVCRLAGDGRGRAPGPLPETEADDGETQDEPPAEAPREARTAAPDLAVLQVKARLLEKLPAVQPSWSAAEYGAICDRFLKMLESLDRT